MMNHEYSTSLGNLTLYCGDALTVMRSLPDASVHLILVDPPYYKVKTSYNGEKLAWDTQWPTREAYLAWLGTLAKEWQRVLTSNGSVYCFASPQMAAWVEVTLSETFNILQRITWRKPPFSTKAEMFDKDSCRMFFPASEAIIFAEHPSQSPEYETSCNGLHGSVFESIRQYLDSERQRAGISKAAINEACGFAPIAGAMASRHYFSPSQWCLPTREHYEAMQRLFNRHGQHDYLRREYEDLRREYEDLRREYEDLRREYEDLRRPFTVSAQVPYTDVWDFATVPASPGKHAAEKPLPLLRHIIEASSRPGDTVLDCCAGSFSTLEAAQQCGRKGIGIEQDAHWYTYGQRRLKQLNLFG